MRDFETLKIERDERGVLTLWLNRPDKKNALSGQCIEELTIFARDVQQDPETRVVVLRGAGDIFCAGGDLSWMKQQIEADRAGRLREARKLAEMLRDLNEMRRPMIGVIQGGAFGGGVGLACICDSAIGVNGTKFGFTETKLGLIPATISPYVLARMGEGKARRVFMSARLFDAKEALALNIIADHVSSEDIEPRLEAEIQPYLKVAPGAVGASKALARALGPRIDDALIDHTINQLCDIWEGEEAAHGIAAFLAKEKPRWG